jgi:hypothetical protein
MRHTLLRLGLSEAAYSAERVGAVLLGIASLLQGQVW